MTYDVTATFSQEQIKLEQVTPIELYVINMSFTTWDPLYYVNWNHDVYGWTMDSNGDLNAVEALYVGLPIIRGSIKNDIDGQIPEISVSIPNTDRVVEALIQSSSYLRGRDIYLLTTFAKFLPSGATAYHIGSSPDRFSIIKEKMFIDSTTSDENLVTFSCKPKLAVRNAVIPRRKFGRECQWEYKGTECGYAGAATSCDKTLDDCRDNKSNEDRFCVFFVPRRGLWI